MMTQLMSEPQELQISISISKPEVSSESFE